MKTANALVTLWAETSIHAGSGSSIDIIDLPIQREAHTGWPCVYGSAMKGALRAKAEASMGANNESVRFVFGPASDSDKASEHAGALMVGDARLLLLPIRSLTGYFKWATSPALLQRLQRDLQRMGLSQQLALTEINIKESDETQAIVSDQAGNTEDNLYLEEYRLTPAPQSLTTLIDGIAQLSGIEPELLHQRLVILGDDLFSYMSQHVTPVTAHIAIDNKTKVVKKGALWHEESLPPETILYTQLSAHAARAKDATMAADQILAAITENLLESDPYLQIGGNETTGMGWCRTHITTAAQGI